MPKGSFLQRCLAGAALLSLFTGCLGLGARERPLRVSRSPWPTYEFFELGEAKGLDSLEGLRLKVHYFTEMFDSRRAFEKGNVDVALLTPYEVLLAKDAGADPVIVLLMDYSFGADGLVAQRSIHSLKELRGKKIGVEVGTVSHFTVISALRTVGLSESDVTILNLGNNDLAQAFEKGLIDAAASWEPTISAMASRGRGRVIFDSRKMPKIIASVVAVRREVYHTRRDDLRRLVRFWFKVQDYYQGHMDESHRIMSLSQSRSSDDLAVQEFTRELKGIQLAGKSENEEYFAKQGSSETLLSHLRQFQEFMLKNGLIKRQMDLQALVGNELVRQEL